VLGLQLEKGEGLAATLPHVRGAYYQGIAMERSGNALLSLGASSCFYDVAHRQQNLWTMDQIYQTFRTKINNQTTSKTSHLLNLIDQCCIPAAETDIIDRGYRGKFAGIEVRKTTFLQL
jgi:hypothetical protein